MTYRTFYLLLLCPYVFTWCWKISVVQSQKIRKSSLTFEPIEQRFLQGHTVLPKLFSLFETSIKHSATILGRFCSKEHENHFRAKELYWSVRGSEMISSPYWDSMGSYRWPSMVHSVPIDGTLMDHRCPVPPLVMGNHRREPSRDHWWLLMEMKTSKTAYAPENPIFPSCTQYNW